MPSMVVKFSTSHSKKQFQIRLRLIGKGKAFCDKGERKGPPLDGKIKVGK